MTHWKRLWCWEGLGAGGEGDNRGWDGWMASLTQWTWVWVNSGSWWWTGRPGVLLFMGSQRVRHDWATELNWTEVGVSVSVLPPTTPPERLHIQETLPSVTASCWAWTSSCLGEQKSLSTRFKSKYSKSETCFHPCSNISLIWNYWNLL